MSLLLSSSAPAIIDENGNAVSDLWEKQYNLGNLFTTFDPTADPDGDGWSNAEEALAGTDPLNGNPPTGFVRPEIEHIPAVYLSPEVEGGEPTLASPEALRIQWPTLAGKTYTLFSSVDLSPQSWLPYGGPRIGSGSTLGADIPLTQPDGSIPQALFLRVAVGDTDTDGDGLTNAEEYHLGSSPSLADTDGDGLTDGEEHQFGSSLYLADTDNDGENDFDAHFAGRDPRGDGLDHDGDGVPDNEIYSVEFEIQEEGHSFPIGMGFKPLAGNDAANRYLTKTQTNEYSIAGSPRYTDIAAGLHTRTFTVLVNGTIEWDQRDVFSDEGTDCEDYTSTHKVTLGAGETLELDPLSRTVASPAITATEQLTTSTETRDWKITKNGLLVSSGTETITVTDRVKLSDSVTYPQLWTTYFKPRAWDAYQPMKFGPLEISKSNFNFYGGAAAAAERARRSYLDSDFNASGTISLAGGINGDFCLDIRLKSVRWRWVSFDPNNPFTRHYATPPTSVRKQLRFSISQFDNNGVFYPYPENTNGFDPKKVGIVTIDCIGTEGTTGWQEVPLEKFNTFRKEDPSGLAMLDFQNSTCSQVYFDNSPMNFLGGAGGKSRSVERIMESSGPPTVHLKTITTDDVQISGGEATVSIQGDVYDAIMGTVPAGGGADIEGVKVFLNGVATEFEGTLQRKTDYKAFWTPEGPKASIQAFNVTMPASGMNRITVETTENAAGLKGRAEFDVVFEKTFDAAVSLSAQTIARDLLLPSSFTVTAMDTVHLVQPGQQTGDDLVETANDSHVFQSAQSGVSLVIDQAFQPSSLLDGLPCILSIPGVPLDNGAMGTAIVCQETGPASLRFAYSRSAPASSERPTYQWTLSSVAMGAVGYVGMAHPVAFRTPDLGEDAKFEWLDTEFPITHHEDTFQTYASTAEGKPLIGFLIRKEDEDGIPSREFIYYDHEAGAIQRKEVAASAIKTTYKLKFGEINSDEFELPVVGWRLLNHDAAPSDGLLPVSIESLIDLAEGNASIEIPEESQGIVEITGRKAGDVLRMFSPEETGDRFDLTVPGENPRTDPASRNAALVGAGEGVYRTQEKLVIYSSGGDDGPVTLTDSQWQALKTAGYLAVHNAAPVIASTADLGWAMEKFGPPHPGEDVPMGANGVIDPRKADFHRFPGYTDHHVFNQYETNLPKRNRWKLIFGNDFDVDEFTVPVKKGYHEKISRRLTDRWESFLTNSFDSNHQLKPGVDIQELRRLTLKEMTKINEDFGINTSLLRPYPQVLNNSLTTRPRICNILMNRMRLGSSLDRLKVIEEMASGPILKGTDVVRNAWWKNTLKKVYKREGKKNIGKLIPILSSAMTVYSIASASINVTQLGWEEAAAQEINEQLSLDDMSLAREAVRQQFNTGLIGGGTPRPVLALPNGQVIGMNERTYKCLWGNSGLINSFDPYVISEIKVFPDGTTKIAAVMEEPPFESMIVENPDFIIRDYWPKVGDSSQLYLQARVRAMANPNGDP